MYLGLVISEQIQATGPDTEAIGHGKKTEVLIYKAVTLWWDSKVKPPSREHRTRSYTESYNDLCYNWLLLHRHKYRKQVASRSTLSVDNHTNGIPINRVNKRRPRTSRKSTHQVMFLCTLAYSYHGHVWFNSSQNLGGGGGNVALQLGKPALCTQPRFHHIHQVGS